MRPTRPAARRRRVTRSTSATTSASTDSCDHGERPRARCEPIDPRRRRRCTGRGSRLWASACRCRPVAGPSIATRAASGRSASRPTVVTPRVTELARGDRADAPEPLHRERVQERELAVGRHHEEPVRLGDRARDLGEELRPRHPDRDRQAHPLAHVPPQARGDLGRRADAPLHPADVEERLVDRDPLDDGAPCRRRPGTPPCSPPRRPTSEAGRRPREGTAGGRPRHPSRCARRRPSPRSSPRAPPPGRRSRAGRAGADRHAARPTRRTRRGRRAGSMHCSLTRTYVLTDRSGPSTLRRPRGGCGARSAPRSPRRPPATSAPGTWQRPSRAARAAPP